MVVTGLAVAAAAWGVLMGLSPMLQIRQMLRRRSSRDVSIGYFGVLMVGFVLWMSYGIAAHNLALIVPQHHRPAHRGGHHLGRRPPEPQDRHRTVAPARGAGRSAASGRAGGTRPSRARR